MPPPAFVHTLYANPMAPIQGPGQSGYSRRKQESKHTWDRGKHSAWYADSNTKNQRKMCHLMRRKVSKNLYLMSFMIRSRSGRGIKKHARIGFRSAWFGQGHEHFVRHGWSRCEGHCKDFKSETFVQQRQGKYAVAAWNAINALSRSTGKKNLDCVCDFVYFFGFRPIHECRNPLLCFCCCLAMRFQTATSEDWLATSNYISLYC